MEHDTKPVSLDYGAVEMKPCNIEVAIFSMIFLLVDAINS